MKRCLWLLMLFLSVYGTAQTIDKIEYFFTTDPGPGSGIDIPITPGINPIVTQLLPTTSLGVSFHNVFVRARYDNGLWGIAEKRTFVIIAANNSNTSNITAAEAFFDSDPGIGNGTIVSVGSSGSAVNFSSLLPTTSLAEGFHNVFIRARDASGQWSISEKRSFVIIQQNNVSTTSVTAAETFLGIDPGVGNGTPVSIAPAGNTVNFLSTLPTAGLNPGFYNVFLRVRDAAGQWSIAEKRQFYISSPPVLTGNIVAAESFADSDPGVGNGNPVLINPSTAHLNASLLAKVPCGLSVGQHLLYLRVKDADGNWSIFDRDTITVSAPVGATIGGTTAVCQNAPSPNITFTALNGTPPYTFTYSINSGASLTASTTGSNTSVTIPAPTGTAGTFAYNLLSVADANCSQSQTGVATITVRPLPTASITGTAAVCRNASSPNITFTGASGTPPYTFTYNIDGGLNQVVATTGSNTSVTVAAPTGTAGTFTYNLVSVADNFTCSQNQTGSAAVTVRPLPTASMSGTTAVCRNAPPPNITFIGASGTPPYTFTYNIDGGLNQVVSSTGSNTTATVAVPTNTAGTFTYNLISVTDNFTCSQNQTGSAAVTVRPLPTAGITGATAVCRNAASPNITFTGASGTPPYTFTYNIDGGLNQVVATTGSNTSVTVAAPTGTAGTFTYNLVSVADNFTCSQNQTGSAAVTVRPLPTATITGATAVCRSATSPNITLTGASGTPPYTFTYNIDGGLNQVVATTGSNTSVTVAVPTGTAGTFTYNLVSVADNFTCSQNQTGSAAVTVRPLPTATISGATAVCRNATSPNITFTGASGTPPYTFTYNIDGGLNQVVATTGSNTSVTVAVSTGTAGTFTYNLVSVADNFSCSQNQTGSAAVTVRPLPTATITGTTAVCRNATSPNITFTGASGTVPYTFTYNIDGGLNQVVTTTGSNTSVTVAVPTGTAGTFTYSLVSVADNFTCSQNQTGSAAVTVRQLPTATITGATAVCRNATSPNITFSGASGTPPYTFTYNIDGGLNQVVTTTGSNSSVTVAAPTSTAGAFTYNLVSVADNFTCSQNQTGSAVITVRSLPTASISGTIAVCQNATSPNITFTGAGGATPYVFTYKVNGGTNQTVATTGTNTSVTVAVATSSAGVFSYSLVSVADANCSQLQTGSAAVTVNPLPAASISGISGLSPTVTFTGANGTMPYTFTYNVNGLPNQTISTTGSNTSVTLTLPSGAVGSFTYNLVSVADGNCSQSQAGSVTVTVSTLLAANITGTTTVCRNATSPNITFTGVNGTLPYTFTYNINGGLNQTVVTTGGSPSATVAAPTGSAGTFTYNLVSVADAFNSQSQTGSATVTVNALPTASISGTTAVCLNSTPMPNITFTGAGGSLSYTFTYKINGGSNQTVTTTGTNTSVTVSAPTGTTGAFNYTLVSVADANCSQAQSGSATVTINPLPVISGALSLCDNGATQLTGSATAAAVNPWVSSNTTVATVSNTGLVSGVSPGTATITYANSNGCQAPATVTVNPSPTAVAGVAPAAQCFNASGNTFSLSGSVTNGTAGWTVLTNTTGLSVSFGNAANAVTTVATSGAGSGTITLRLTSASNQVPSCGTATSNVNIVINPLPTASVTGTTTVCQNSSPVPNISFTGAGGTVPYTFTYRINSGGNQTVVTTGTNTTATVPVPTGTPGSFTYTLVSVADANCAQNQSGSAVITITPLVTGGTVSGPAAICLSQAPTFTTSSTSIGTWSSTNTGVATIDPVNGIVSPVAPGNTTITFTVSTGCGAPVSSTAPLTINPNVSAGTITGNASVCTGLTTTFTTSGTAGGAWSSSDITVATVNSTSGVVTGITAGSADISYTVISGCGSPAVSSKAITVNVPASAGTVTGASPLCIGGTASYVTSGSGGGTWSSSNPVVASVDPGTGAVIASTAGNTNIIYAIATGCGTNASASQALIVDPNVTAGTITGPASLNVGQSIPYTTSGTSGGSWSSSNVSAATVDPATGLITAVSAGLTDIAYTLSSGCGSPATTSTSVTVNSSSAIPCGNNGDRIIVCHKGTELCLTPQAAIPHLAHGDVLGHCIGGARMLVPEEIQIIPNPNHGLFSVRIRDISPGTVLRIIDKFGKIVLLQDVQQTVIYVNIENLAQGLYTIEVVNRTTVNRATMLVH
jgi:hypothetical protein